MCWHILIVNQARHQLGPIIENTFKVAPKWYQKLLEIGPKKPPNDLEFLQNCLEKPGKCLEFDRTKPLGTMKKDFDTIACYFVCLNLSS